MQAPKRKRYQKDATHDDILTLIHLVRQNPALYNYKLQPNQRRRIDVLNGWAHIAAEIGNKYSVEDCRRKWKNLRDTYHQYRLRKPRLSDGLSKWRYAKELDFLSSVYQPKLKTNRQQSHYEIKQLCLPDVHDGVVDDSVDDEHANNLMNSSIALVNDDAETFILASYEESVADDVNVPHMVDHRGHMELTHNGEPVDIVKHEHPNSLDDDDDDGATGAEVDYEEVCLYEEASNVTETIIGSGNGVVSDRCVGPSANDTKTFQYISNDFCIESLNASSHLSSGTATTTSGNHILSSIKLKNPNDTNCDNVSPNTIDLDGGVVVTTPQISCADPNVPKGDELDLFFGFLKKKLQSFSRKQVTEIQIEFLNCVLRRDTEDQKTLEQQQQQQQLENQQTITNMTSMH